MNAKVLVTDTSYKHALAACRALDKAGYEVHTIGQTPGLAGFSRSTKRHHRIGTGSNSLLEGLMKVVHQWQIDVLLPIGANSVSVVSRNRAVFGESVSFALPSHQSIDIALDKGALLNLAKEASIAIPESREFNDERSFCIGVQQSALPLVVKSSSELSKFGPFYINTEDERTLFLRGETYLEALLGSSLLVQSRIVGPGVGFFALYQHGLCKRAFVHQRLRETPNTGGSSWAAMGIENELVTLAGTALLDLLEWHGPAMVEFKLDTVTGVPFLMELNPKFWGSLDLAIASGVDSPSDTCRVALGENLQPDPTYKVGVKYVWPLEEIKSYLRDKSLHGKQFRSNVDLKDPIPTIVQLVRSLLQVASKALVPKSLASVVFWLRTLSLDLVASRVVGQVLGFPISKHCKVGDELWVGAKPSYLGRIHLKLRGIRSVVSLLTDQENVSSSPTVINLPIKEYVSIPTEKLIEYTNVLEDILAKGPVFIHCREGVGRAPALAVAYLQTKGKTLESALKVVCNGRSVARINSQQLSSLTRFEEYLKRDSDPRVP